MTRRDLFAEEFGNFGNKRAGAGCDYSFAVGTLMAARH